MNNCKPCGGVFLQGACRSIAIADFLSVIFAMIFNIVGTVQAAKDMKGSESDYEVTRKWLIILTVSYFVLYIFFLVMAAVLFIGSVERCRKKCSLYLVVWCVLIIIDIGLFATHEKKISASPLVCVAFACFHAYKMYSLWVVYSFIKEMKSMGDYNDLLRNLNDQEILDFERGDPNCAFIQNTNDSIAASQPFNKEYEIPEDKLAVNKEAILGSGAYGMVLKGKLTQDSGEQMDVAVKTTKPDAAGVAYFKALLLELKIMAYVGSHANIVNLLGAVTKNIRSRELLIVVEFCPNGNLESYLRKNRTNYRDLVQNDTVVSFDWEQEEVEEIDLLRKNYANLHDFSTENLLLWSLQLAKGMQYLGEKRIIHGDLACRNVLLMMDNRVKITDFGLSRKMYNYASYVKKESTPLPWKYMAVEALKDLKFSPMSDVWAYGVTLWELFSLGDSPFAGLLWTSDFAEKLIDGLRLQKPKHATTELYQIMMDCWQLDPHHRPDFEDLKCSFTSILARVNPTEYSDTSQKFCYYNC
ncbi:unnamed protein product [Allacma fusca]|uniref:Protein kinase domain-containing protein n=1 Tax=Allacma fusca TaxID=39272 RepID=A0A8J2LEV4_9HEXA|nr:unnamed protein product [Allacma fusca]